MEHSILPRYVNISYDTVICLNPKLGIYLWTIHQEFVYFPILME